MKGEDINLIGDVRGLDKRKKDELRAKHYEFDREKKHEVKESKFIRDERLKIEAKEANREDKHLLP